MGFCAARCVQRTRRRLSLRPIAHGGMGWRGSARSALADEGQLNASACGAATVFDVGVRGVIGRYCSDLCRKSVSRWGVPSRNEDEKDRSPAVWDGVTEISKAPREYDWRVYCMLCGGQEYKRATLETMRAVRWLSPCERCGGVRWIEEDYGGRMLLSERPTRGGDEMDGPRPIHEGVPWKQPA
jgi:hypothetical protein